MPEHSTIFDFLGVSPDHKLGQGGEAVVYAMDADRVARVYHDGTDPANVGARVTLLEELAAVAHRVPFAIPTVLETVARGDRIATVEQRLPGRPINELLGEVSGATRERLIRGHLDAAARIGDLTVDRPWAGELMGTHAIHTVTFADYLARRAEKSLATARDVFAHVDTQALAAAWPEPAHYTLVHLDAFTGNMLAEDDTVTAVLDFGVVAISGDRRLDPLAAAAYLTPWITPTATDADRAVAAEWIAEHGLAHLFVPAQRWLAAFWSFARDDQALFEWCKFILSNLHAKSSGWT
ncbi:MAG: phosphotransferase [Caldilineaceae bacterium]|nr:phosphotransferase [Caldilineaceae bacterium]